MSTFPIRFENGDDVETREFEFRLHTIGRVKAVRENIEDASLVAREMFKGADTVDFSNADTHDIADAAVFFLSWTPKLGGS